MLRLMRETKMARSKITPELLKEARTLRREPFKWPVAKIAGALDVASSTLVYNLTKYNERGPWDVARLIVKNVRDRAKAKGIEISKDFTAENVAEAIGTSRCAISGQGFDGDYRSPNRPSPDRIDPQQGYSMDNVRFVRWAVNRARSDLPEDDFVQLCREVVHFADTGEALEVIPWDEQENET